MFHLTALRDVFKNTTLLKVLDAFGANSIAKWLHTPVVVYTPLSGWIRFVISSIKQFM